MIAAPFLSLLLQATAASPAPPPPSFYRVWEDADVSIDVAQGRVCGRAAHARQIAGLRVRLRHFVARARTLFGEIDNIVPMLEPPRGRACDAFRPAVVHATRKMAAAEAFLASAQAGRRQ